MTSLPALPDEPAGPTSGRRVAGICLAPLAGATHLLVLDRYARGALLAAAFVVGWSLVAAGTLVWTGPGAGTFRIVGWGLVGASVALSVADALRWLVLSHPERRRRMRDAAFRRGLAATVRGEPLEAVRDFREAVRLDPGQPASRFHLGVALGRVGRLRAARRQLRRSVRWDPERVWLEEARRELERLAASGRRRRIRNKTPSRSL